MKKVKDTLVSFPGLVIIHQKIAAYETGHHSHEEHEFFLPLQGQIAIGHAGDTVKAGPGKMLYVPPSLAHDFTSSATGSGERLIWLVEPKLWQKQVKASFAPTAMPANTLAKELLFYLLVNGEGAGSAYFIAALLEGLKQSLESANLAERKIHLEHVGAKAADPRLQKALQILRKEYATVTLSEVGRRSGLSARTLHRLFLKEVEMSPKDMILLLKVERAKALLRDPRATVTDVALQVGYESLSKFIATFKRIEGMLPSDYRDGEKRGGTRL